MGAKRNTDGFASAYPDSYPKVIDVAWDPVGFRSESDWYARHVHKLSMAQLKVPVLVVLAVSVWQLEIEYGSLGLPVEPRQSESCTHRGASLTCHPEDFENAGVIFGAGMT
jgi:hypothetical protein